jgi:outer membrane protein assembly factor BamB
MTISRSASYPGELPLDGLHELWTAALKPEPAHEREERLIPVLTAPVCAGSMVFAALSNRGELFATESNSGKKVWSVLLGSRIDAAPTYHAGLVLLGCNDGYVYALRATVGAAV